MCTFEAYPKQALGHGVGAVKHLGVGRTDWKGGNGRLRTQEREQSFCLRSLGSLLGWDDRGCDTFVRARCSEGYFRHVYPQKEPPQTCGGYYFSANLDLDQSGGLLSPAKFRDGGSAWESNPPETVRTAPHQC